MTKYAIIATETEHGDNYYVYYLDGGISMRKNVNNFLLFDDYDEAQAVIDGLYNGTVDIYCQGVFEFKIVEHKN